MPQAPAVGTDGGRWSNTLQLTAGIRL